MEERSIGYSFSISSAEFNEINEKYVETGRFRTPEDFVRFTIRNFMIEDGKRQGLYNEPLSEEKIQAIKELLGIE